MEDLRETTWFTYWKQSIVPCQVSPTCPLTVSVHVPEGAALGRSFVPLLPIIFFADQWWFRSNSVQLLWVDIFKQKKTEGCDRSFAQVGSMRYGVNHPSCGENRVSSLAPGWRHRSSEKWILMPLNSNILLNRKWQTVKLTIAFSKQLTGTLT